MPVHVLRAHTIGLIFFLSAHSIHCQYSSCSSRGVLDSSLFLEKMWLPVAPSVPRAASVCHLLSYLAIQQGHASPRWTVKDESARAQVKTSHCASDHRTSDMYQIPCGSFGLRADPVQGSGARHGLLKTPYRWLARGWLGLAP